LRNDDFIPDSQYANFRFRVAFPFNISDSKLSLSSDENRGAAPLRNEFKFLFVDHVDGSINPKKKMNDGKLYRCL
jgi:hypothetical protein